MNNNYLLLGITPDFQMDIEDFFAGNYNNKYFKMLQKPKTIRRMGWSMETLDIPKIIEGRYFKVTNSERKDIRLYRDGSLIAKASIDNNFLGWGQSDEMFSENPKINTTALVEYIFNYFIFYSEFLKISNMPLDKEYIFITRLNGLNINGHRIKLSPNPSHGYFNWESDFVEAPTKKNEKIFDNFRFSGADLLDAPSVQAYKVVKEIFLWFGLSEKPPYSEDNQLSEEAFRLIT